MARRKDIYKYDYSREQWENLIDSYIFSQRDRDMLKRWLLDMPSFEELADEFGYSVRHTKTIIYNAGDKLFSHI